MSTNIFLINRGNTYILAQIITNTMNLKIKGAIIGAVIGVLLGVLLLPTIGISILPFQMPFASFFYRLLLLPVLNNAGSIGFLLFVPFTALVRMVYGIIVCFLASIIISKCKK